MKGKAFTFDRLAPFSVRDHTFYPTDDDRHTADAVCAPVYSTTYYGPVTFFLTRFLITQDLPPKSLETDQRSTNKLNWNNTTQLIINYKTIPRLKHATVITILSKRICLRRHLTVIRVYRFPQPDKNVYKKKKIGK